MHAWLAALHLCAVRARRGEFVAERKAVMRAIDEAYTKGYLGKNACGSGIDFDLNVRRCVRLHVHSSDSVSCGSR